MKKHKIIKLILITIISGVATFSYLVYTCDLVKEEDLTRTSLDRTSWLLPRQWKKYNKEARDTSDDTVTRVIYGDGSLKDNKSSSVLLISQMKQQTSPTNALPEYYETLRESLLNEFDPSQIRDELASAGNIGCKQKPSVNKSPDKSDTNGVVGLISVTASCPIEYSSFIIKIRLVVGKNDGIVRAISLSSAETTWKKNKAAFDKMLGSISTSGSYAIETTIAQN